MSRKNANANWRQPVVLTYGGACERLPSSEALDLLHSEGRSAYENLMSREVADPEDLDMIDLADLAGELGIDEAELGFFAWQHLPDGAYDIDNSKVTPEGADLLRTFLAKD